MILVNRLNIKRFFIRTGKDAVWAQSRRPPRLSQSGTAEWRTVSIGHPPPHLEGTQLHPPGLSNMVLCAGQRLGYCAIGGTTMSRVIAVLACGFILTGCSSSWMPSMDMPGFGGSSGAHSASLAVESDPPGAEARASSGATCRTPCRLDVTASDALTVNIALNGYVPKSVPIHVLQ